MFFEGFQTGYLKQQSPGLRSDWQGPGVLHFSAARGTTFNLPRISQFKFLAIAGIENSGTPSGITWVWLPPHSPKAGTLLRVAFSSLRHRLIIFCDCGCIWTLWTDQIVPIWVCTGIDGLDRPWQQLFTTKQWLLNSGWDLALTLLVSSLEFTSAKVRAGHWFLQPKGRTDNQQN